MSQFGSALKAVSLGALAAALVAPLPAAARDRHSGKALDEIQDRLGDPATQNAIGDAMASMMAAMLDLKAAPFLKAMDGVGKSMGEAPRAHDIPEDATLGDLAGPQARAMPREVARQAPAMIGAAGAMVGAMGEMLPQLEEMGKRMSERMRKSVEGSMRAATRGE